MILHHLFYSADVGVQTLHRRITPTAQQREQQQERWRDLRDYLADDLGQKTGYAISSWLQGSYKFGTQTRPAKLGEEFDIDLGLYFVWPGGPDATNERPADLKAQVQQSLEAYAEEAQDDVKEVLRPAKERCSRIRFSGDFHIDVPSYHLDQDRDARDLATETNGWEQSDPKALWLWFGGQFGEEDSAQVRRLIRYVKMWAGLKLIERPSSVLLTVLVAEEFRKLAAQDVNTDDLALRNVAMAILNRLGGNHEVPNPVDGTENLNRLSGEGLQAFLTGLRTLTGIADGALAATTEQEAAFLWTEAFDHFFPASEAPAAGNGLVHVPFIPEVNVEARPKGSPVVIPGMNSIGPIPKDCTIVFTLTNAQALPVGSQVRWFARNTGEEAELVNDMGHVKGVGLQVEERSAYRGTHHMDVVVTSYLGRVIGFRRIPVQVAGTAIPARNPSRPGYRRFASRRR